MTRRWRSLLAVGVYAAILVAWELIGRAQQDPAAVLVAPSEILQTMWSKRVSFLLNTGVTLSEAALGLLAAIVAAIVLALVIDRFRLFGEGLYRLALIVYSVPLIALAPALVAALGLGTGSKIAIAALGAYFPILVNVSDALRTQDPRVGELGRVLNAGYFASLLRLRAPAALPAFFASLKIAAPAAFIAAIIAEWIGAESGLGLAMMHAMFGYRLPDLWAILVISTVVNGLLVLLFSLVGRLALPWHETNRRRAEV